MKISTNHKAFAAVLGIMALSACSSKNTWTEYEEWRDSNLSWYDTQRNRTNSDGTPYFTVLAPDWNKTAGVLIRYHNDRSLTEGNLSPMITSTITTKYKLSLYNGTGVDSSYNNVDSVYTGQLSDMILGWHVALTDMRCGDSATVIVPYTMGYGADGSSSINPYSTL